MSTTGGQTEVEAPRLQEGLCEEDRQARPPQDENALREEEARLVRRIVQMIVVWLPLFLPVFLEQFGARALALVDVAGQLFEDMRPEYYAFSVLALLVSLHAKAHAVEDLCGHLDQLTPAAIDHQLLGILPDAQRRDAIRTLASHPGGEAARGPVPGREA
jgi:hypothetical protein